MKLDTLGNRLAFNRLDPLSLIPLHTNLLILLLWMRMMIIYVIWQLEISFGEIIIYLPYHIMMIIQEMILDGVLTQTEFLNSLMNITCISTSVNPPNVLYYGTDSKYIHRVDGA